MRMSSSYVWCSYCNQLLLYCSNLLLVLYYGWLYWAYNTVLYCSLVFTADVLYWSTLLFAVQLPLSFSVGLHRPFTVSGLPWSPLVFTAGHLYWSYSNAVKVFLLVQHLCSLLQMFLLFRMFLLFSIFLLVIQMGPTVVAEVVDINDGTSSLGVCCCRRKGPLRGNTG